jgi:DHA3 family multidrug efflux protein-like MFS transporter
MHHRSLFLHILTNTAVAGFTNMLLWFAITFWAYLTTKSVFVTGMLGGIYLVLNLFGGIWFWSLVDHHRKRYIMLASSVVSLFFYVIAFGMLAMLPSTLWESATSPWLWVLMLVVLLGVVAGNIRMISLSTMVTMLIPEWERDKANGQVGMVNGITFTIVSAFSGFIVGRLGMGWAVSVSIILTFLVIVHLLTLDFPAETHLENRHKDDKKVDLKGTIQIIAGIGGLFGLIFFAMWNNFLGGVFMALMDAYGLSMVSVETWWVLLAITSTGFIIGGILVSRYGLGANPVRRLLLVNLVMWLTCIAFPVVSSIWLVGIGFFAFMLISPMAEAAEQTIFQKVVPLERQGRVFGFAQSVENIASPLTAFLVGPLTQFLVMPWVAGGGIDRIVGNWWGTTPDRAMAVMFVLAGIIGIIVTLFAFKSRSYRDLSHSYQK